jgi:arabinogalactan endo-1,4-beta-galactosidase
MRMLIFAVACSTISVLAQASDYAIGADLSFLRQIETSGVVLKDGGIAKPGLQIFKDCGFNWVRLRLFHSPTNLPNNLAYTIASAQEAKKRGFKFLLDFHYSDTWADPGKQFTPRAWTTNSHAELVRSIFDYTRDAVAAFRDAGAMPDMVQPGNEIIGGMLWPDGKLPDHWDNFADLLKSAIAGVEAGRSNAPRPLIMIHIDRGGDAAATKWFFDHLNTYDIHYDVIGQSFYPWLHGSLADLQTNLNFMAETYRKDIVVVETAYAWKPLNYRGGGSPFPETPAGQFEFWEEFNRIVRSSPRGCGVFWWEPAVTGRLRGRGMFDDDGNALPILTAGPQQRHEN